MDVLIKSPCVSTMSDRKLTLTKCTKASIFITWYFSEKAVVPGAVLLTSTSFWAYWAEDLICVWFGCRFESVAPSESLLLTCHVTDQWASSYMKVANCKGFFLLVYCMNRHDNCVILIHIAKENKFQTHDWIADWTIKKKIGTKWGESEMRRDTGYKAQNWHRLVTLS